MATDLHSPAFSHEIEAKRRGFELCRSDTGDGGWSLHLPGDDVGDQWIVNGTAEWDESIGYRGDWNRPNDADYRRAALKRAAMT